MASLAPTAERGPGLVISLKVGCCEGRAGEDRKEHPREIIQTLMKLFLLTCVNKSEKNGQSAALTRWLLCCQARGQRPSALDRTGYELITDARLCTVISALL